MSIRLEEALRECQQSNLPYEEWQMRLSEKHREYVKESIGNIYGLYEKDYRRLGFKVWDEGNDLLLIPAWLYHLLPDGIRLTCINGEQVIKGQDHIDTDDYFGCISYGIEKKIEKTVEIEKDGDVVKKVQIDEKLSDEIGEYTTIFYYRFEKETGVGIDHLTGQPCAIHCHIKYEHINPISEESYKIIHEVELRNQLARESECEPSFITPLSKEQYEAELAE